MDGNIQLAAADHQSRLRPSKQAQLAEFDEQIADVRKQIADELAKIEYVEPADSQPRRQLRRADRVRLDRRRRARRAPSSRATRQWEFVGKAHIAPYQRREAYARAPPRA